MHNYRGWPRKDGTQEKDIAPVLTQYLKLEAHKKVCLGSLHSTPRTPVASVRAKEISARLLARMLHPEDQEVLPADCTSDLEHVCTVPLAEVPQGVSSLQQGSILVHRDADRLRAARNTCMHRNGKFNLTDIEDSATITCPAHGWKLDASRMCYINPAGETTVPCTAAAASCKLLLVVQETGRIQS